MRKKLLALLPLILSGCYIAPITHSKEPITYFDFECRTRIPEGVSVIFMKTDSSTFNSSSFGTESIDVGCQSSLPDTLLVEWVGSQKKEYIRTVPFKTVLPPLDPRKEKYHFRFTFYQGDSVRFQVRKVALYDCRHTIGVGATSVLDGPCGLQGKDRSRLYDSIFHHIIPRPGPAVFPDD